MKYLYLLLPVVMLFTSCKKDMTEEQNPNLVTVIGSFQGATTDTLYLRYNNDLEESIVDTALFKNDSFSFSVEVNEIRSAQIFVKDSTKDIKRANGRVITHSGLNFYLVPGDTVFLDGNYDHYNFSKRGDDLDNLALNEIDEITIEISRQQWDLYKQVYGLDSQLSEEERDSLGKLSYEMYQDINKLEMDYYLGHGDAIGAVRKFRYETYDEFDPEVLDTLYQKLSDRVRNTSEGVKFKQHIDNLKNVAVGAIAPDFSKMSPDSVTEVALSDFRGKYVLVDFWGSWCGPCRRSHPHLRGLYDEYQDKGFEILAVASERTDLDKAWTRWIEAIEKDSLSYSHVLNDYDKSSLDIVELYAVTAYPTKFLIDPEGKIMMRELGYMPGQSKIDSVLQVVFKSEEENM